MLMWPTDYGNNGGLCTARASEETAPTLEAPPPAVPSNHQTPCSGLQSHPSNPLFTTLLPFSFRT
ncbi:hypothetical protein EYF80_018173 [Liparis tanakae]|uniref:Uncharacterized protein n=1 Tax=Liparis tanakae TaxID=230148 RepID=A0A4Z2I164_9TELE|nr:hypothetical protein EYF80_018173 [Liparis tanakae]